MKLSDIKIPAIKLPELFKKKAEEPKSTTNLLYPQQMIHGALELWRRSDNYKEPTTMRLFLTEPDSQSFQWKEERIRDYWPYIKEVVATQESDVSLLRGFLNSIDNKIEIIVNKPNFDEVRDNEILFFLSGFKNVSIQTANIEAEYSFAIMPGGYVFQNAPGNGLVTDDGIQEDGSGHQGYAKLNEIWDRIRVLLAPKTEAAPAAQIA